MKIGIDLDMTLNNLEVLWEGWIRLYDQDFKMANVKSWGMEEYSSIGKKVYDFLKIPGIFDIPEPRHDAERVVADLAEKHTLYVVTAYLPSTCVDKVTWLGRFFPMVPTANIVFCNDKSILDLDVLIDDGMHNLVNFKGRKILFDAPWNQSCDFGVERVYDWQDIENLNL